MPLPARFTVCTYNIWTWTRWPERKDALQAFVRHHMPDILCLQELQSDSRAALDEVLGATHSRVDDPFEGWTCEGNLYWRNEFFELLEHGAEQVGILEPYRRMFWARLRVLDGSDRTILVSTAHLTWHGHPEALASEKYVRMGQARAVVEALNRLQRENEPQLFMGDLNDQTEVIRILHEGGLVNCFAAMGRMNGVTWPANPNIGGPCSIDWIVQRGPIRPMTAGVIDYFLGDLAPSDHKPVIATYALEG